MNNRQLIETLLICDEITKTELLSEDEMEVIYKSPIGIERLLRYSRESIKYTLRLFYGIITKVKEENCENYISKIIEASEEIKKHTSLGTWEDSIYYLGDALINCKKEDIDTIIVSHKILRCTGEEEIIINGEEYEVDIPMFGPSGLYFKLKDKHGKYLDANYALIVYKEDSVESICEEDVHTRKEKMKYIKDYMNDSSKLIVVAHSEEESYLIKKIVSKNLKG